jgi:hypothetical protein
VSRETTVMMPEDAPEFLKLAKALLPPMVDKDPNVVMPALLIVMISVIKAYDMPLEEFIAKVTQDIRDAWPNVETTVKPEVTH